MIFSGNVSFLFVLVFIVAFNVVAYITENKKILNALLFVGSVSILLLVTTFASIGIICLISLAVFYVGRKISVSAHKNIWLRVTIAVLLILYAIKNYQIIPFDLLERLGISYILFRLVHFLIESKKGTIKNYNLGSFLNYIIFFPTFLAGPIDTYPNFDYWIKKGRANYRTAMIKAGSFKIALGVVKKFFLAAIIVPYSLDFSYITWTDIWFYKVAWSVLFYSFYLLLDFSGYSDIAIGTAYLIGIKTPENFNTPYLSPNLSNFWKRWHMTFSDFLFKYVFKPLVLTLSKGFRKAPRLSITFSGYLITFIICGIWHGNTWNFVYWGLWHGIGLIGFKLWHLYVTEPLFTSRLLNLGKKVYSLLGIGFTFLFVTAGWFFFNYETSEIKLIGQHLVSNKSEKLIVNPVFIDSKSAFEIKYKPIHKIDSLLISYENATSPWLYQYKVKASANQTYYLASGSSTKKLARIEVSEMVHNEKKVARSELVYSANTPPKLNDVQALFFDPIPETEHISHSIDTLYGTDLWLPEEILLNGIHPKAEFIANYGWSINLRYEPLDDYMVDVELKAPNSSDWQQVIKNRKGAYGYVHLHGESDYKGTKRNLEPGRYEVRLKYKQGKKESQWLLRTAVIENYVDR